MMQIWAHHLKDDVTAGKPVPAPSAKMEKAGMPLLCALFTVMIPVILQDLLP